MNYDQNQNGLNNNGYNNNYNDNNNYNNNYNNAAYNNAYNNGYNNGYNNYGYNPNMMNNNMGNMNNNNKEPLSYHIKRFLIGFLLLVLLIFILLWLFPTKQGLKDTLTESLNPLYERSVLPNFPAPTRTTSFVFLYPKNVSILSIRSFISNPVFGRPLLLTRAKSFLTCTGLRRKSSAIAVDDILTAPRSCFNLR